MKCTRWRRPSRLLLAFLASLGLVVLLMRTARGGTDDGDRIGWTIQQGGSRDVYLYKDSWQGSANPNGFMLRNTATGTNIYYYGTFRVVERLHKG